MYDIRFTILRSVLLIAASVDDLLFLAKNRVASWWTGLDCGWWPCGLSSCSIWRAKYFVALLMPFWCHLLYSAGSTFMNSVIELGSKQYRITELNCCVELVLLCAVFMPFCSDSSLGLQTAYLTLKLIWAYFTLSPTAAGSSPKVNSSLLWSSTKVDNSSDGRLLVKLARILSSENRKPASLP